MVWENRGITHRSTVTGMHGMVSSAHPLATLVGLHILMKGGNAVDSAVATAAALNVVEPYMSGLGGGGAMLIHLAGGKTVTLLYGGVFPKKAIPEELDKKKVDKGPKAITVPGSLAGWLEALKHYGTLDPEKVFTPAITYAEEGVALTVKNSIFYAKAKDWLSHQAKKIFSPSGDPPKAGIIIKQPQLAETFRTLARDGIDAFYNGSIGAEIERSIQEAKGLITQEDLSKVAPEYIQPSISTYRDFEIRTTGWPLTSYEIQLTLNILEGVDLAVSGPNTANTIHHIVEAIKISAAERVKHAGKLGRPPACLLSKEYAASCLKMINPDKAIPFAGDRFTSSISEGHSQPCNPSDNIHKNTTHFDVIDKAGNAVSVTQSIGATFGSGFMAGDTGIMMNNFLSYFDLDLKSPNVIRPGCPVESAPFSPTMLFQDGKLFLMIGTPGEFGIPQTTVQMISNVVDHRFSVQAAIEAPRVRAKCGLKILIEDRIPEEVKTELKRRGHKIQLLESWSTKVGGAQGILIDPETQVYYGGADPRRDGYALGW